jgi:F420-non-reducing hydrogenase small subunit
MSNKPKIAFYWCASCGGCEESVVDLAEDILTVVENVDIVLWPVAMDFKRKDVEALPDKDIACTMINGAIRTTEQEDMAHLLRRKSQVLIAYGSCAHTGGIPGLANQFERAQIMRFIYHEASTVANPNGTEPVEHPVQRGHELELPGFQNLVRALDQVIDVDYYIPGCAPDPGLLLNAVRALLGGELPAKGSVLAPNLAQCDKCPRIDSKPADLKIAAFKRPHLHPIEPDICLLAQGFACLGPATRGGCGEKCMRANMPCSGCYGPLPNVQDHGAKALAVLCSLIGANDEAKIDEALEGIPDPVGTFYRYGLSKSMLRRKVTLTMSGGRRNG